MIRERQEKLLQLLQKLENAQPSDRIELIRGKIRSDLGQSDQSLTIFNALIRKKSHLILEAKLEKVKIKLAKKETVEALDIFKSIENKYLPDKNYYDIIYQLALLSLKSEDRWLYSHKYLKAARRVAYLRPRMGHIYANLAAIEKERSGPGKAMALLEKALQQPLNRVAERTIKCYLEPLKRINSPIPDMDITTWLNSEPIEISNLQGKIILIYFWSPGCHSCRQLFPRLQQLSLQYQGQDFLLLGITRLTGHYSDDRYHKKSVSRPEEIHLIKNLLTRHRATFPIALVEQAEILRDFGVLGFPTLFLIDRTGHVTDFFLGTDEFDALAGRIHGLISEIKVNK